MAAKNNPSEIYITRMYEAPLNVVWDAWTDPKKKEKWWGPRGFTLTTHHSDIRTGGTWDYTMHGPDGVDYPNSTKFLEVEKHQRLVYDHGGYKDKPPMFRVTANFSEVNGKTLLEMTMTFPSPEIAKESKKFIKAAGGDSTWDRLAEHLSPVDRFVINRSFDAPLELMYELWTDPKHFANWMPPKGFTMQFIKADVRPGGTSMYCMTSETDSNMKMYGKVNYREFQRPNKIIYTQEFCDVNGDMARHPMAPTWPATMLTNITFTAEDVNRTRVTIVWEVFGEATAEERQTFHAAKGGMTQGWTGSFDKLEDYIPSVIKS